MLIIRFYSIYFSFVIGIMQRRKHLNNRKDLPLLKLVLLKIMAEKKLLELMKEEEMLEEATKQYKKMGEGLEILRNNSKTDDSPMVAEKIPIEYILKETDEEENPQPLKKRKLF